MFTKLADRRLTGIALGEATSRHHGLRHTIAAKFLDREGDGPTAKFSTRPKARCLTKPARATSGGILIMLNARLFKF